jgi:hypothetical protein
MRPDPTNAEGRDHPAHRAPPRPATAEDGSSISRAGLAERDHAEATVRLSRAEQFRASLLDSAGLDSIPDPQPVIDGLLYTDSLAWLTGKRSSGKSFVALDMACCVSLGLPWHGHEAPCRPVLYVVAEGVPGMRRRVRAWEDHARAKSAVMFLPLAIRLPADGTALALLVSALGAGLVIIDTQARVTVGLDENSSKDMGLLIDSAERIREPSAACVLLVHHEPREGTNPRGHSAIDGAGTGLLRVVKDGPLITVTNPKQKDAVEAQPVQLALVPQLSSAVLRSTTAVGLSDLRTDSEQAVLTALLALVGPKGGGSYTELATDSGLPLSTFKWAMNRLVSRGEIRNAGSSRRTFYIPASAGEQLALETTKANEGQR